MSLVCMPWGSVLVKSLNPLDMTSFFMEIMSNLVFKNKSLWRLLIDV